MDFGVRTISERVIVRMGTPDMAWIIELTLDEAILTRAVLDRAIDRVQSGESVARDFESFIHTIPGHEPV
jgi:hypothetical protein